MEPTISVAIKILRQAHSFLQQVRKQNTFPFDNPALLAESLLQIESKTHKLLAYEIARQFPDQPTRDSASEVWQPQALVGPLEFARGLPNCAVVLSHKEKEKADHVALLNPVTGEEFFASKGKGAQFDGRRVRVSPVTKLDFAFVALHGEDHNGSERVASHEPIGNFEPAEVAGRMKSAAQPKKAELLTQLERANCRVTTGGCALLNLFRVGAGQLDAAIVLSPDVEELSSAFLYCQEAGAFISDLDAQPLREGAAGLICTNAKLRKRLLTLLHHQVQR